MRYFFYGLFSFLLFSCSEAPPTNRHQQTTPNTSPAIAKEQPTSIPKDANQLTQKVKQQQKCTINGEVLEDNELWLKDQAKLICIMADSTTYDAQLGMSHRILEIFDTYTCQLDLKLTLPINVSPDYPYFLADINYNNNSKIIAIKAAKTIYCLDLETKKMLPLLAPKFKAKRPEADAASGTIIHLELWENFLIGYAQDKGTFVFDLSNQQKPKSVLPFAEFQLGETHFNSLFLLPSINDKYQAILPNYDWDEEVFSINPIFKEPLAVNTDIQKSALNNRFLVLRQTTDEEAIIIDLEKRMNRALPTNLLNQSTKEILKWAKLMEN